ncbi:MAG: hypothetical protein ACJAS4_000342 [Bacteriovoracaceae bacterium]|jgi:hypothetical protein
MYKILEKLRSSIFILTIVACNSSNNKATNSRSESPREPEKKPVREKVCTTKNVEKILNDGRTIVSRSKSAQSAIILWDLFTQKVKRNIDFAFKYLEMSTDGEYLIRQISSRRFQLLSIFSESINYNYGLNFKRGAEPILKFSDKDNLVSSHYRILGNRFKINVFDVESRDFLYGAYIDDLKYLLVNSLERMAIVKSSYSKGNRVLLNNLRNGNQYSFSLKAGNLSSAHLTDNVLVVTINKILYSISTQNGSSLFSREVQKVFSIDKREEKALVSYRNGRLGVLNLIDGQEEYQFDKPKNIILSSCQLDGHKKTLVCKDSVELDKVQIYKFDLNQLIQVCL